MFWDCRTRTQGRGLTPGEVQLQKGRTRAMKEQLDQRGTSQWCWGSAHHNLPLLLFISAQQTAVAVPARWSKDLETSIKVFEGTLQKETGCGWRLEIDHIQAWILLLCCSGAPDASSSLSTSVAGNITVFTLWKATCVTKEEGGAELLWRLLWEISTTRCSLRYARWRRGHPRPHAWTCYKGSLGKSWPLH